MTKTGKEIEGDVLALMRRSYIVTGRDSGSGNIPGIRGGVYRATMRPRDSKAEDMTVMFTTATAEQVQEGVVTLNIFVPDILNRANGVTAEDGERCEQIERLAQDSVDWLKADKSNYLFSLERAIHTNRNPEISQSFVVVPLRFRYID